MSENVSGRIRLPQGFDSQAESIIEGTLIIEQGSLTFPDGTFFTSSIDTAQFVTTSSFNSFVATYNTGSFSGSFTGSLLGTSSRAIDALTASLAPDYLPIASTSSMLSPYVLSSQTSSFILNSQTSSMAVLSSSFANTSSFIDTTNLTALPTVVAFTAPVASVTSGGTAAETTLTTLTVPAGIFKSGDQILLTLWGSRTTGASSGVNSTLTTRITDIAGATVIATTTGNRHHNYTLTGRCLSDTSIIWWQNSPTTAAATTTVPSLASSGFTLNFSVTRDLNTSEFTLYNAICRKYN